MPVEQPRVTVPRRWSLDPLHMTLRRQPRLRPVTGFSIRMAIMIGMIVSLRSPMKCITFASLFGKSVREGVSSPFTRLDGIPRPAGFRNLS